ncbi:hypothetical protein [Dermatophilus congolensis]|uniref:Uncharacterized protein n=1 Tax=Dermatophilus congolensis TaxID=1863 RepID=A0A239VSW1_9MICO|nr:hypothetical protein [Dermatophilus congolensis]MBO3129924.1 hypothetical protein [Dermatophilus congolensis]MBO3131446.1 hypothetical protein [Dermatophilus congolensis]MBO3134398.1 hypothetical protein [Dermatophilus congolensis]MBO3136633.1 hypothetical protein [Dermatophilus congolensis]MBO3138877.1 hypothetical protein [Dermatophilus congolensis]
MKAVTPHAHPAVEAGCWILSIVTSLMASQTSGEITWLLLGFVAPGAYWLAVARPMRDKSPELELQNAVYFNNAARLTLVSFLCCFTPWFRPVGGVLAFMLAFFLWQWRADSAMECQNPLRELACGDGTSPNWGL